MSREKDISTKYFLPILIIARYAVMTNYQVCHDDDDDDDHDDHDHDDHHDADDALLVAHFP